MSHEHDKDHSCAICDAMASGKSRDEVVADILAGMTVQIAEKGFVVHGIDGTGHGPSFAYTTGLTEMGMPEIFIIGLSVENAANGVAAYVHMIKDGVIDRDLTTITQLFNLPVEKCNVTLPEAQEALSNLCGFTRDYYEPKGLEVKWAQLVMCDDQGLFPWDHGFNHDMMDDAQPLFAVPPEVAEHLDKLREEDGELEQIAIDEGFGAAHQIVPPTIH
ncbi:hypothetical protein hairong_125 [Pseudomonas phage hairong]|nr:hypothetical protein hairong_125 [Pseudomonas phage hairong]